MEPRSDPDRQIEDARASLVAHLGELGRRFRAARARLDLPAQVAAHPLASVGAAFALGALLGMRGRPRREGGGVGLGRAAAGALGALAVRLAKDLAVRSAAEAARGWWEHHPRASPSPSEIRTSYDPSIEPFLER
jgi:hypothetical protein